MRPSVYIETTVVSYLVARPSGDPIMAERQRRTCDWWRTQREGYRLFTSELVIREAGRGDPAMAQARIEGLAGCSVLVATPEVIALRDALVDRGPLPPGAHADAEHIAFGAVYGLDFLMTWNCRHIANPRMRDRVERVCRDSGFEPPTLSTPDALPRR